MSGLDYDDHRLIWAKLEQVHEKHPDMVLIHGKPPKGAEKIASLWAKNRNVPQIGRRRHGWPTEKILIAHGQPITESGYTFLVRAFRWLARSEADLCAFDAEHPPLFCADPWSD